MRRREFITLLGGAATATWPVAARAQQGGRMRRIGVLVNLTADDPEGQARLAAFLQALHEAGWAVGRNLRIDTRWSAGDASLNRRYAEELVALAPDVIFATGGPAIEPLRQATHTLPIVFAAIAVESGTRSLGQCPTTAGHRGGMMVARSALSPSSPAPAARRKSGVGA